MLLSLPKESESLLPREFSIILYFQSKKAERLRKHIQKITQSYTGLRHGLIIFLIFFEPHWIGRNVRHSAASVLIVHSRVFQTKLIRIDLDVRPVH